MLAICVADVSKDPNAAAARHAHDAETKLQHALDLAEERATEDTEGWKVDATRTFGPDRPPPKGGGKGPSGGSKSKGGLYTSGGALLDV
jgi:hypothetical protein